MGGEYFNYYFLSYFTTDKIVTIAQILHVLRGKKTPSMYYLTEINHWHHGFSLKKRLKKVDLERMIQPALNRNLLVEKKKGFLLTNKGESTISSYFKNHYFPKKMDNFMNIELYEPFWEQLQLFTQVFSEYSYRNNNYGVIIKNIEQQEKIKQLFRVAEGKLESVLTQWIDEQEFIFRNLQKEKANVLASFLTGHNQIGKNRKQLAVNQEMYEQEFLFYIRDIFQEILEIVRGNQDKLTILSELLSQLTDEYFMSMSKSTFDSYKMLKRGKRIQEIAKSRRIKENTVKEHILEIAFILESFPIKEFVPNHFYQFLHKRFTENKSYSFRDAKLEKEELEFLHYRLVELERMRME